jgi:hypothetical protein
MTVETAREVSTNPEVLEAPTRGSNMYFSVRPVSAASRHCCGVAFHHAAS